MKTLSGLLAVVILLAIVAPIVLSAAILEIIGAALFRVGTEIERGADRLNNYAQS
jgi:hypothetical protein